MSWPPSEEERRRHDDIVARNKEALRKLQELNEQFKFVNGDAPIFKYPVNKRTHRIRFENESEDEVTIIIERL